MYAKLFKGAPLGNDNAKGPHKPREGSGLHSAIDQHIERLQAEANDWAGRKYKPNANVVHHQGDGPGKEFQRIDSINRNRRDANVSQRQAQIAALQSVKGMSSAEVGAKFNKAKSIAEFEQKNNGRDYDQVLDAQLGKEFTGTKDSTHGPNSVGGTLKPLLQAAYPTPKQPAAGTPASADEGWLKTLFGG